MQTFRFFVAAALCVATVSSDAEDAKVHGVIKLAGKPLTKGRIAFHYENGQFVGSQIQDGKYSVGRIPVGKRQVTLSGNAMPSSFTEAKTTPLILDVKPGANRFDFDVIDEARVSESFDGDEFDQSRWQIEKSTPDTQIRVRDEALVVSVAPEFKGVAVCMQHKRELTGDIEVRCDLEVLDSPKIVKGWINLELVLIGADGQFHSMIGLDSNDASRFSALYMPSLLAQSSKRKYRFVSVKQTGTKATLCIRRIGTEMFVGVIRDGKFVETKRFDCDASPLRLRMQCFMREAMPGATRFRIDNLRIRTLVDVLTKPDAEDA